MQNESVQYIFADVIDDPRDSMRGELDRELLWELADDIKVRGLINPITVRPVGARFEVVAGHRRFTACKMAGVLKIACVVRNLSDDEAFGVMASENLVREDVDPVDEAAFIFKIKNRTGRNEDEIAKMLRRSPAYVYDRLVVASMPDYLQTYLKNKQIKLGSALALFQITNEAKRRLWVELAVRDGVSVRQAEFWLHQWKMERLPDAVSDGVGLPNAPVGEYSPPMFVCALDGRKYPAQDMDNVFVFKGNMKYLFAIRSELNLEGGEISTSPGSDRVAPAPLGAAHADNP